MMMMMMRLHFFRLFILILIPYLTATQSLDGTARSLDTLLQDYAYRAFPKRPRTGIPYDGNPPPNLPGIKLSVLRLRSGSLRKYGVNRYKEFQIPIEVAEKPYVTRLALVYQNLGNWSSTYYPLQNHTYLSPVLGLLAYSAANLSATNLTELDLMPTKYPILVHHSDHLVSAPGLTPKCVSFNLNGAPNFTAMESGSDSNTCSTFQQGHFALVVEGEIPPVVGAGMNKKKKRDMTKIWVIVGSVLGGLLVLILLAMLIVWLRKYKQRKKLNRMERTAVAGETLRQTSVGSSARAPYAFRTRTQPALEADYVPF